MTASIHPQAVGWWVLAVLAGLAGLAVIGQALGRQSVVESEEYPTLAALGLPRRQLVVLGTARNLLVALAGATGAVVVAFALSPLTPVGEARLAEPSTGLAFDPLVLLLGALAIVVVVLVLGVWPAVRASRVRIGDDRVPDTHPSSIVAQLAATGAPPSAVIGVRHALERGRGAASVPVGTALFGTALAVLALCATAVFGASLSHLTATPALYGEDYQVMFVNNGQTGQPDRRGGQPGARPSHHRDHARHERRGLDQRDQRLRHRRERPFVGRCSCRRSTVGFQPATTTSRSAPRPCTRSVPIWGRSSTSPYRCRPAGLAPLRSA